jgi:hypothetical protein
VADEEQIPEDSSSEEIEETPKESDRRHFNPMKTYIEMAMGIFVTYTILFLVGIELVIMFMLFLVVFIYRETLYVRNNYTYGFVRKVAYFNALHSTVWFLFLAINGYFILQTGSPIFFPQIPNLTELSPLFVLMAVFGSRNLVQMYAPSKKPIKLQ